MTALDFGKLAYREGNRARIREALLDAVKAGEGWGNTSEFGFVEMTRRNANATETAWLEKYDAARQLAARDWSKAT
jgi:hypothetical protein